MISILVCFLSGQIASTAYLSPVKKAGCHTQNMQLSDSRLHTCGLRLLRKIPRKSEQGRPPEKMRINEREVSWFPDRSPPLPPPPMSGRKCVACTPPHHSTQPRIMKRGMQRKMCTKTKHTYTFTPLYCRHENFINKDCRLLLPLSSSHEGR